MADYGSKVQYPEWLNNSFLEKALRTSDEDENISVTSSEVSRATAAGDNYASDMFRVQVHFCRRGQEETLSLIVKADKYKNVFPEFKLDNTIFERESLLLGKIVPRIHKLLQETLSSNLEPLAAKCFYSHFGEPVDAIVLEDLTDIGYKMAERTSGLDMNHCLLVLRTLARYHAASVLLYKNNPESFEFLTKSIFTEQIKVSLDPFFGNGMRTLAAEITKWPEFDQKYGIKLKKISEVTVDHMVQCQRYNPEDFNALVHGDLWLNNMMFRYSKATSQVQNIRFVDFQLGFTGDVALDLQYFLHTSPSIELLDQQYILVEEYHKTLRETFSAFGHHEFHPSLEQLKKQLHNKGMYAVIIACCLNPVVLADRSDIPDMLKVLKNEESVRFTKHCKEVFRKMFPVFEKNGWLEVENYI